MTEVERTDPGLRWQRRRLDVAKLAGIYLAAAFAAATMVVVLIIVGQTSSVANLVADCTTPTGQCYQQQQQINAQNRARLINATVAANYCSQRTKSLDAMQACVSRTLEQIGDK